MLIIFFTSIQSLSKNDDLAYIHPPLVVSLDTPLSYLRISAYNSISSLFRLISLMIYFGAFNIVELDLCVDKGNSF
jgi:hypothetical protein